MREGINLQKGSNPSKCSAEGEKVGTIKTLENAAVAASPNALELARLAAERGRLPRVPEPEPAPPAVAHVELWQRVPRCFYHLRASLGDRAAQRRVARET